jgi:hypothetical protein
MCGTCRTDRNIYIRCSVCLNKKRIREIPFLLNREFDLDKEPCKSYGGGTHIKKTPQADDLDKFEGLKYCGLQGSKWPDRAHND